MLAAMRVAILSDIHANREALDAALEAAEALRPDRIVLLGDLVGYGPDPEYAIERAERLLAQGALCLRGNHDEAVLSGPRGMNEHARAAVEWTRDRLSAGHRQFLASLPLSVELGSWLFVHASADRPASWPYVLEAEAAERCLAATAAEAVFCGHTHLPAIFYALPGRRPVRFSPLAGCPTPLSPLRRHVVVAGAVGQPRDGDPAARLTLFDAGCAEVTMLRAPYDADRTAQKIAAAGLPAWLGMRLKIGR